MLSIFNSQNPIISLAPMDGVTDAPFRYITAKYGKADISFTEFTHVHGLCVAGDNLLHHFLYHESERYAVAQIYGAEPEYFYHAAKMVCALGFDAVDINMGCPAKTVAAGGAGAGLIRTPELALQIVAAVKQGVADWAETGKLTGLRERTLRRLNWQIDYQKNLAEEYYSTNAPSQPIGLQNLLTNNRQVIPVSIKTRIGYDVPITQTWISNLNKSEPAWITVHGRTLKQMYTGKADWNEVAIAVKSTSAPVFVNGDVKTAQDLEAALNLTQARGALIGRASFGNPWLFKELINNTPSNVSTQDRFNVMLEHTQRFVSTYPSPQAFMHMRKHFAWYTKDFPNAAEVRVKLMQVSSLEQLQSVIAEYI